MFNYKTDQTKNPNGEQKIFWQLDKSLSENQNANFLCPNSLSENFVKAMENGISPLNEIRNSFHENIPIFDNIFFKNFDHFIKIKPIEGMALLEFLFFGNINNTANFYGKHSIPIILSHLPQSFQIVACLLSHSLSPMANERFYSIDWISFFQPFFEDPNYHFILSVIYESIEPLKINKKLISIFFDNCDYLLNSPDINSTINILCGFHDNFYPYFPNEIAKLLTNNFKVLVLSQNENIIELLLLILSNVVTDDTIEMIFDDNNSVFSLLTDIFASKNEKLIDAASDFLLSLVSYNQAYSFITSPNIMDHIFNLASNSLFSTRKNMILILCDLIIRKNKEKNLLFLANGVLDLLIDFLGIDQHENTFEIIQGIRYLMISIEGTNQMNTVVNTVIENQELFYQLEDHQCLSIASMAEEILKDIRNYTI